MCRVLYLMMVFALTNTRQTLADRLENQDQLEPIVNWIENARNDSQRRRECVATALRNLFWIICHVVGGILDAHPAFRTEKREENRCEPKFAYLP